MAKLVATEYVTVDGVFQDPGGSKEYDKGGWSFPFWGDDVAAFKYKELQDSDTQLLGRVTYQGFAAAWPTMTGTGDFGEKMNAMPKYVVSRTLKSADWNNSHIISDNLAADVNELRAKPGGDILLAGSGMLLRALIDLSLVDELRLLTHPVVVGSGKCLFDGITTSPQLKFVGATPFKSGIVLLTYIPEKYK